MTVKLSPCVAVRCVGIALMCCLASSANCAENLLKNPGLEQVGPGGVPADWQREYNEKLSGPFMLVQDAHGGKNAVCMMTEEWNYQRPQFITQTVKLPPNAKSLRLSAWCKGQGQVNLVFRFLKDGKSHKTEKIDMGFGPVDNPVEQQSDFALAQTYETYEAWANVPPDADAVMVKVGNTTSTLNRMNIWGKVWVDDIALEAMETGMPQPAPQELSGQAQVPDGCRDIAPLSRIVLQPPSFNPAALVDGDAGTAADFMGGVDRAGNVNVLFPKPLLLRGVSLYLLGNVELLVVRGDTDGDGTYDLVLSRVEGLKGKGWLNLSPPQQIVHAIRIQPVKGESYGFRKPLPFTSEVKVFIANADCKEADFADWGSFVPTPRPGANLPELSLKPVEMKPLVVEKRRFRRMICADLWMWGADASKKDSKVLDYRNNEAFRRTVAQVKQMHVDSILIDLTNSSCWNLMPWPSKVCNGTNENILKAVIDALHAEGLEVFVEIIHNIAPFETIKWHYPEEETSRYPEMKQYPSIIHGDHVKQNWLTIMDEIMACGADGVGISSDEQYYKGHFMETFPKDDPGRRLYRERFGHELPEHEEDSLAFRQWIQMRHEGICDLFGYWTSELKKKYPNIYTNTMLMHWAHAYSYITETGIPVDMLGARGGITEIGSDYMGPYGIRMAAAANGWRRATMLHNGDMWPHPPLPAIHFYGTTLWNIMYGAGSVNYWRCNYVVDNGHAPALTCAYQMANDLEALGVWDARPPRQIALLSSRASIDWWQIAAWWGKHDNPDWDRAIEGGRGWFADECVFNILQQNGYPFDWFFMDYPDRLEELEQYRVIVIPFAYSVSRQAAERIEAAVRKGAKVLLLDGRDGPTNEWGEPHPEPVLKHLAAAGHVALLQDDILAHGGTDRFAQKVTGAIDAALGAGHPFKLHRYGAKVDATVLEKTPRERFVFLINWEKKPVRVDIQMHMPEGKYEVLVRDETAWHRGSIGGREEPAAALLESFSMTLESEKPCVLYIKNAP
jgi:hypothetical protein